MGPQVGYYVPQILMEEDLHGPGLDARGAAFPGVNLYVELGHGRDYAWSATTATTDNIDTFAEVLCQDEEHYTYKGQCVPMEKLEKTNTWTSNALDKTPPGSEKLTVFRTKHGIVYADCDRGAAVAAKRTLDVAGHYGRPDIFRLEIDRAPRRPVGFATDGHANGAPSPARTAPRTSRARKRSTAPR